MKPTIAVAALLALIACQQNSDNIAIDDTNNLNAEIETLPPDEGNEETAATNNAVRQGG